MSQKKVLVVDDEELVLSGLARALRREGVEVRGVTSAEEALDLMTELYYDLCFLDIRLPGMDGLEAARRIRSRHPRTRLALMTANLLDDTREQMVRQLGHYFVSKPFDVSSVREIMEKALQVEGESRLEAGFRIPDTGYRKGRDRDP